MRRFCFLGILCLFPHLHAQRLHVWNFQDEDGTILARALHEGAAQKVGWDGVLAQTARVQGKRLILPTHNPDTVTLETFSNNSGALGLMTGTIQMDVVLSWNLAEAQEDKLFHIGFMHDRQLTTADITLELRGASRELAVCSRAFGRNAEASPKSTRFTLRESQVHLRLELNFNKAEHILYHVRNGKAEELGRGKLSIDRDGNWLRARLAGPWPAGDEFLHVHHLGIARVAP